MRKLKNNKSRRTILNLPEELLSEAQAVTGENITKNVIKGLNLVKKSKAFGQAQALRGKLDLKIDIKTSRERNSS